MTMTEEIEHVTLGWIKKELDGTLNQARQALEQAVANPAEAGAMQSCVECLHLVHGSLRMVERFGAAMLAEEMEQLALAVVENRMTSAQRESACEVLMRAVVQLPDYLELLQSGRKDIAYALLPLLNDLRAARGENLLSENALFAPNLQTAVPDHPGTGGTVAAPHAGMMVRKLRHAFQTGLVGWYRDRGPGENLRRIGDTIARLEDLARVEAVLRLWWVCGAVVEALLDRGLEYSQSMALLLGQVDRQIKRLMDEGEEALAHELPAELLKNLLYYVARATSRGPRVDAVKAAFRLDTLLPDEADVEAARASLAGRNLELLRTVSAAIKEDLSRVKETLDLSVRHQVPQLEELRAAEPVLRRVADTLGMLGLGVPRRVLQEQAAVIAAIATGARSMNEAALMDVASTLLYIESSLDELSTPGGRRSGLAIDAGEQAAPPRTDALLDTEYEQSVQFLIGETVAELARTKEAVVGFINAPWDHQRLEPVPESLEQIRGAMVMLGAPRAAALIGDLQGYVGGALIAHRAIPDGEQLDALADAVTGLECYLEGIAQEGIYRGSLLEAARRSAERLSLASEALNQAAPPAHAEAPAMVQAAAPAPAGGTEEEESALAAPGAEAPSVPAMTSQTVADEPAVPEPATSGAAAAEASAPEPEVDLIDEEILGVFFEEAREQIAVIAEQLGRWRNDPQNREALTTLRRAFHTLKGSGRLVGASVVGEFAWAFENLLNRVIDGTATCVGPELFAALEQALDALPELVENAVGATSNPAIEALMERAQALSQPVPAAEWEAPAKVQAEVSAEADAEPTAAPGPATEEELASGPFPPDTTERELSAAPDVASASAAAESQAELARKDEEAPHVPAEPRSTEPAVVETLADVFRRESVGHLAVIRTFLERCRADEAQCRPDRDLQRALHTLRGSAEMADAFGIASLAAALQQHVESLVRGGRVLSPDALAVFEEALEAVEALVNGFGSAQPVERDVGDLRERIAALAVQPERGAVASGDQGEEQDGELVALFLEEAAEGLEVSDAALQRWRQFPEDASIIADLQRRLHTLKGDARTAGAGSLGDLSHALESSLTAVVDGRIPVARPLFDVLQRSLDRLQAMLEAVRETGSAAPAQDLIEELQALPHELDGAPPERSLPEPIAPTPAVSPPPSEVEEHTAESVPIPPPEQERRAVPRVQHDHVRVRADVLDNLVNYAGEVGIYRARLEQQLGATRHNLVELEQTVTRLREQLRRLEIETEAQILFRYEEETGARGDFDPLELDRFSQIQQLSRSLAESVTDLTSIQSLLDQLGAESQTLLQQQARVQSDLQDALLHTRMVPFARLAPRLRRVVRQTCRELGKRAELRLNGADGELDRAVMDHVVAPLEHMLRNAVAHGIELPELREAAGKPPVGIITVTLSRQGSEVALEVADDGAGLDIERIRARAAERGLLTDRAQTSDAAAMRLVLESGFSTAEEVTQVYGRGVGMDVVMSELESLGGAVDIDSQPGRGTRFTLRVPFTLSITRALLAQVGEETYAIPLTSVEGLVRMSGEELARFDARHGTQYENGGHAYRVRSLGRLMGGSAQEVPAGSRAPVLLVRSGDLRAALQVDALLGSREIVVKPAGPQLAALPMISGATILGDGRVLLILDASALARRAQTGESDAPLPASEPVAATGRPTVMVVDDSITVRKVTTRLLQRHDLQVVTAKDGVDALALLEQQVPDIMLLDIEMPRMDGYELATHIRNDDRLRHVPILMITSRSGAKHRERAMNIGVNDYLGKPYQEAELLERIHKLLDDAATHA